MEEGNVLHQWDAYATQYLTDPVEFNIELMDKYTYLITQCQQASEIIGKLEDRSKNAEEILKYKFRIKKVADPPTEVVACVISNYKSSKRN